MGGNSFFAKLAHYDPLNKFANSIQSSPIGGALKWTDPLRNPANPSQSLAGGLVQAGNEYGNRMNTGPQVTPAFAGKSPTLGDSLAGYQGPGAAAPQAASIYQPTASGTPSVTAPTAQSQAYVQQAQKAAQMQQQRPQGQSGWGNGSYGGMSF